MRVMKKTNRKRRHGLLLSVGIFIVIQFIFILIDGTRFVPKINDSSHIVARIGRVILDSKLFTEWITLFTTVYITALVIQIISIICSNVFANKLMRD